MTRKVFFISFSLGKFLKKIQAQTESKNQKKIFRIFSSLFFLENVSQTFLTQISILSSVSLQKLLKSNRGRQFS